MTDHPLPTITGAPAHGDGDTALRVLVIGSFYAVAVFFAVAFSPAIGFVHLHQAEPGRIAAAEPAPAPLSR